MDKRKRSRIVSRAITIVVVLGAMTLIALGFIPKPVPASVAKVERRTLEVTVDEPGKTRLRARHVISAPVTGQLARIALRAGDRVEQGAVLAEITPVTPQLLDARSRAQGEARVEIAKANRARAKAATRRAASALAFARDQAERSRKLQAQGGASQQALEQAEYQARAAEEELATLEVGERVADNELTAARAALASLHDERGAGEGRHRSAHDSELAAALPNEDGPRASEGGGESILVRAPLAGQVLRVLHESAGVVQSGTPLLELGDLRALEVVVDVLSADAVAITPGASARIERWGGTGTLNARVRAKEPSAFTTRSALGVEEQRVPVLLDLTDPIERWRNLGDGYRVEARILTARIEDAVVVPASALFRDAEGFAAFVLRDARAHKTAVAVGARTPDWVEVKGGLSAGDTVVIYPSDQVTDGVKLEPQGGARRAD
jgi:HlyD family secretion protein